MGNGPFRIPHPNEYNMQGMPVHKDDRPKTNIAVGFMEPRKIPSRKMGYYEVLLPRKMGPFGAAAAVAAHVEDYRAGAVPRFRRFEGQGMISFGSDSTSAHKKQMSTIVPAEFLAAGVNAAGFFFR